MNPSLATLANIDAAAAAIANARIMRRGSPAISNVLDILPPRLKREVIEDAEASLNAVELSGVTAGDLQTARHLLFAVLNHLAPLVKEMDKRLPFPPGDEHPVILDIRHFLDCWPKPQVTAETPPPRRDSGKV